MKYKKGDRVVIIGNKLLGLGCNKYIGKEAIVLEFNKRSYSGPNRPYKVRIAIVKKHRKSIFCTYNLKENEFRPVEGQLLFDFMYDK